MRGLSFGRIKHGVVIMAASLALGLPGAAAQARPLSGLNVALSHAGQVLQSPPSAAAEHVPPGHVYMGHKVG